MIFSICTMMTQLVCQQKMERSADNKKVTAKKISPARVVHPTLLSGLHYKAIVFGSTQLLFLFECAHLEEA